ncbi:MAG: DUF4019 domain-containing protein [Pseudomonadota bacterium]
MKQLKIWVLILSLYLGTTVALAQDNQAEEQARQAVLAWLALVDSENYDQSWTESAAYFRTAVTRASWAQILKSVRQPLGKVISRKVRSAIHATTMPGAPDGEYFIIGVETSFEKKRSTMETVTPMLDKDGIWRVSGYYIR